MDEAELITPVGADFAIPEIAPAEDAKPKYDRSIVEGPLASAVWKIAWPTMLANVIGGLQGWVDHIMVGNLIGYQANAAIGPEECLDLVQRDAPKPS